MSEDTRYTFLDLEWDGCLKVEVTGDGEILVGGEDATPRMLGDTLAKMAKVWKADRLAHSLSVDKVHSETAILVKGPYKQWEHGCTCRGFYQPEACSECSRGTDASKDRHPLEELTNGSLSQYGGPYYDNYSKPADEDES